MSSFVVEGVYKLSGTIRPQGAKNEALQIISAVLLTKEPVRISNIPEILDIKNLEYISSAGLRVLLGAQKKMLKVGSMKVINVCEEVMEVFEMTGFADILVIE